MAIVEMTKLKLFGVNVDKQKILDALFSSSCVQLTAVENTSGTKNLFDDQKSSILSQKQQQLKDTIDFVESSLLNANRHYQPAEIDLSLLNFEKSGNFDYNAIVERVNTIKNDLKNISSTKKEIETKRSAVLPYTCINENFDIFFSTKNVLILLGIVPESNVRELKTFFDSVPLAFCEFCSKEQNILKVFAHNSVADSVQKKLADAGFVKCSYNSSQTASELVGEFDARTRALLAQEESLNAEILGFEKMIVPLKIAYDQLGYEIERLGADNFLKSTTDAFCLEGYLPKKEQEKVSRILDKTSHDISFEFLAPTKDEMPPTLLKNVKIVTPFESVTNMYSPPNYHEIDPNGVLSFFFAIFFGFIMADIGYGLVFIIVDVILNIRQKSKSGFKTLMNVLAVCGLATVIFGVLFGSFFGVSHSTWAWVPQAFLPDPVTNVITLLEVSLAFGVFQLMFAFFMKGLVCLKQKDVAGAIFSGFVWEVFFAGVILLALDQLGILSGVTTIGLVVMAVSVATSALGQLIFQKGFAKLSKSVGAVYGVINIFSDVLSYARLFGLMLSGVIIASVVDSLVSSFLTSPATFLFGVFILALGHSFNIAMGALSAYIHVSRLQYVEFFSHFYEGEGELFVPFGHNFSYVNLTNK
jgi:V/A-type H+-transporting ATPase subunit I